MFMLILLIVTFSLSYYSLDPITRGLRQLAVLVNALNRTLIMPKFKCPPTVNLTYCNICSWDDCCEYGFQHTIHNNFKAHV